jgi:hypothetical protein
MINNSGDNTSSKIDIDEKINKHNISFTDKVNNFFNKIDFLELP